ncbi:hypothetical protein B0H66DRAFT_539758 [Apodospora peruviana]|uniref:PCI domain-containing protein n=1 Tax=Apodospora peruviana TaxID=516989 RepID=A0AAE0IPV6_9PEZI|nr:hypothetical protein B0H66DRAFT_539758 [Apodospora peruviana]
MKMEQTNALNALEPFLALTKSATSPRAAADLIVRATSAPNTFLFTELLQAPQIQALASSSAEFSPYLTLLKIFSYGTYGTYISTSNLPPLNDAQTVKLRQLSILTLAKENGDDETTPPALAYGPLLSKLGLSNARELEELVISTIYAGLINAQLDPKHQLVQINSVAALRDVATAAGAITGLLSSLRAWAGRCEATLQSLEEQMSAVRAEADRRAAETAGWTAKMEQMVEEEEKVTREAASASANTGPQQHQQRYQHQHQQRAAAAGRTTP